MDMKEYMAPEMEVIALKMQGMLAASFDNEDDDDDNSGISGGGSSGSGLPVIDGDM